MERLDNTMLAIARSTDEVLMMRVTRDDPAAFALLYNRHAQAALGLAKAMCARPTVAEDVVQEAFLACWRARRQFDGARGSVRAWILGIVRNRAIDALRQSVLYAPNVDGEEDLAEAREVDEPPYAEVARRERTREVQVALRKLPPEQSLVIVLAFHGGYTHSEIAAMLQTPIGTIKGRLRLGLLKMADSLDGAALV